MKKIYFAFLCAACAFTLFSCHKENNGPEESPVPDGYVRMTLKAVSDETKTTVDGTTVKWAKDDQIKVYFSNGEAVDFMLVGDGGSASGEFDGTAPVGATALYAVYPTDLYASVSETTVNVTIPDDSQDGVFGKGNIAVAKVNGDKMSFKNVNAFVGFTVPANITKVVISSVNTEKNLYGTLAVNCLGDPTAGALSGGGSSITVTFPKEKVSTGGTYYVAIAPGVELTKGLLLTWYNGEDVTGTYWLNKALTTASGEIIEMETVSTDGNYYVSVNGVGKKNGMNADNAWSAAQFWSKLHPGGTDTQMDGAKLANIDGATFHLAEGTYNWGTGAEININESETISFTIQGDSGTIFTGNEEHRILTIDGNMSITFDGITFTNGVASGETEEDVKGGAVLVKAGSHSFINCTFKGNCAQNGGAIAITQIGEAPTTKVKITDCIFGGAETGEANYVTADASNDANGGAIYVEKDSYLNIQSSSFIGNHADFYSNKNGLGGAICAIGYTYIDVLSSSFIENYAATGGAAFIKHDTVDETTYYPRLFIDECSFDGNYITKNYGCVFNIAGADCFVMHNSSVSGSYITPSKTGEAASWIDIDGIKSKGKTSISNCTIIGDAESSALVWACGGSWTNYFTNNIITSRTSSTESIHSAGSKLNLSYNHFYSSTNYTDSEGNVSEVLSGAIDGLSWINDNSSSYYWKWNGTFSSAAPSKTNKSDVQSRVNAVNADFIKNFNAGKVWSSTSFANDQRRVGRGDDNWWPGAYQN